MGPIGEPYKPFDWKKYLLAALIGLVSGLTGGAVSVPLCSPHCQCCADESGYMISPDAVGKCFKPSAECCPAKCKDCKGACCKCANKEPEIGVFESIIAKEISLVCPGSEYEINLSARPYRGDIWLLDAAEKKCSFLGPRIWAKDMSYRGRKYEMK